MTACVERVVGTVHAECVQQRLSAKGNYISVTGAPGCVSVCLPLSSGWVADPAAAERQGQPHQRDGCASALHSDCVA